MTTESKTKVMKMRPASSGFGIAVVALLQIMLLIGAADAAGLQQVSTPRTVRIDGAGDGNFTNTVPWPAHWDSLFKCNFESGTTGCGGWTISNGSWKIDKPTRSPAPPHSGIYCALQDTAGNYAPSVDSRLITGTHGGKIALPTLAPGEELQLSFWHWYSLASAYGCGTDYGYVEISTDGGSSFSRLPGYSAFTGASNGWYSPPPIDLSAYAGMQVRIAFRLVTTGCAEDRGWFIDDVVIRKGWDPAWSSLEYPNWETWQGGLRGWMVDSPLWQVGVPSNPPGPGPCGPTCSGGACAATQLTTGYWPSADARLISPRIHLGSNPWLDFQHSYSMASAYGCGTDYGYVEVATCRGQGWGPWQTQATFTGSSSGWTQAPSVDLTAYADSTVRIAFRLWSTGCAESRGWLVDDIQISDAVTDVGGDGTASLPHVPMLAQNVPNPFNPSTEIQFFTPVTGEATIKVLDVAGHQIRTIMSGVISAGQHVCNWDGRNERGDVMPSGIYFYQLRTAAGTSTRHMVLVR